jgi:two-component system alkaline phosphatase synthesis response regulator PhoP
MLKLLFITREEQKYRELEKKLSRSGLTFTIVGDPADIEASTVNQLFDMVLLDIDDRALLNVDSLLWDVLLDLRKKRSFFAIALVPSEMLDYMTSNKEINDFVTKPVNIAELETRIKRALKTGENAAGKDVMKSGDLLIDLAQCEVSVAGRPVELTFKEYELLKFLVSHKGRVFTRPQLLNEVWSYDYYGGDRTVDVHIRRLRSKIEDIDHTFIDTVRNIGYKYHDGG